MGALLISQRELNQDTHGWTVALKSALREDPDVVLVGEMRDYETIQAAMTIAETGHLVFQHFIPILCHKLLIASLTYFHHNNKIKLESNFHLCKQLFLKGFYKYRRDRTYSCMRNFD